jgi:hypothetical protein
MKTCVTCKELKESSEFNMRKASEDGLQTECKACNKQYRQSLRDGLYHVYILPYHHYAGTTECVIRRMAHHKSAYGRNTDNYEVVGSYENREDAKAHEKRLHDLGYAGRHAKNAYK